MTPIDLLPRINDEGPAPKPMASPMDAEIIKLPPRTEDVIEREISARTGQPAFRSMVWPDEPEIKGLR